ncbi:hypothetical protein [Mangrovicoccus algicola]|uniref:Uncharacterized protein n=1 Tax=Mangrovicoccus algicola TaxID=2771008 RepID=A0A8J6Z6J2_9RHOB|nr:hypothetical protein [Mangrovicoccus algicola]MBE3637355.1 hypothetical protein [Mangrovicoccus algicola]
MRTAPATPEDMEELALNMRAIDRWELRHVARVTGRGHISILGDLMSTYRAAPLTALHCPEGLVGVVGVLPMPGMPGGGAIFFLGTDLADLHSLPMDRALRRWLDAELEAARWPRGFGNVIPKDLRFRHVWLQHLGFDFPVAEVQHLPDELEVFWMQARCDVGPNDATAACA